MGWVSVTGDVEVEAWSACPACPCLLNCAADRIEREGLGAGGRVAFAGFVYRPDPPNCRDPVLVYWSGLAGNRSVPVEFKFEFKKLSSTGSYRFTDRFEFKSKFKIACVTGLDRYTGRFYRFTKWALMSRLIFFLLFFCLTLNARKVC